MTPNLKAVSDTVENPDAIYESSQRADRNIYFKKGAVSTYNSNMYTKVVTQTIGEKERIVVSTWPQKDIKGGIGNVIYKK